jgi:TRAP-type mannitol/chloroaromatic compound transport system substrate-binding protein
MDRRDFLKSTGSAAAAVGVASTATSGQAHAAAHGIAAPNIASGTRELTLSMFAPDNGRGPGESARRLAQRIADMTEGAYRIRILAGSDVQDADIRHGSAHDYLGTDAAFAYFAGLPGRHGLPANDLDAWMAVGGGQLLWDDLAAQHGFKPFLAGHSGSSPAIWSRQSLADRQGFQGLRFAAEGLAGDVARGLGAQPVTLNAGEVTAALSSGHVDAVEGPGAMYAMAAGLPEVAAFALDAPINGQGTAQSLAVELGVWQRMSKSHQAAITAATAEEFRLCQAEARVHDRLSRQVMRARYNTAVSQAVLELREAINRMSDGVVAHVAGSSRQAQRINASFMTFRAMLAPAGAQV